MSDFASVWDDASASAEQAQQERAITTARVASRAFWPFLAAAQSEGEYAHRAALAEDRIAAAASAGGVDVATLSESLKADWVALHEARRVEAAPVPENMYGGAWSRACQPHGDGQCDGYVPEEEKLGGTPCACPCHGAHDLPQTIPAVKTWHDEMHSGTLASRRPFVEAVSYGPGANYSQSGSFEDAVSTAQQHVQQGGEPNGFVIHRVPGDKGYRVYPNRDQAPGGLLPPSEKVGEPVAHVGPDGQVRHLSARTATTDDGHEGEGSEEGPSCPRCGGPGVPLGALGSRMHYRCRNCGDDFSQALHTGVRRLAIVCVTAGDNPFAKEQQDGAVSDAPAEDAVDTGDDAQPTQSYYVLDEDSGLDIGGPYASKADAQDAIQAGSFDADPAGLTPQKGTAAENGETGDESDTEEQTGEEVPGSNEGDAANSGEADTGNPFAKGGSLFREGPMVTTAINDAEMSQASSEYWNNFDAEHNQDRAEPEHDVWQSHFGGPTKTVQHPSGVQIHTYPSTGQAYNDSQVNPKVKDGDVLSVPSEGVHGFLYQAWPVASAHPGRPGAFHTANFDGLLKDHPQYAQAHSLAKSLRHITGSLRTQANPYTDENPYASPGGQDGAYDGKATDDDQDMSTRDPLGGPDPGGPSETTKPRQLPGGAPDPSGTMAGTPSSSSSEPATGPTP